MKIFTVLILALTTMPGFATSSQTNTQNTRIEKKIERAVKNITSQKLYGGAVISVDRDISQDDRIRTAFQTFKETCSKIPGVKETKITSTGSDDKTIKNTCVLVSCDKDKGYDMSKDKKTCIHVSYKDGESCVDTVSDKHAKTAIWEESTKTCKIETCITTPEEYVLQDNKCIKKTQADKKEAKEPYDTRNQEQKDSDLAEKQKAYEDAKANEQSTANKTLTALTTAATGIGGMELAMGLSEQKADKDAANSMAAYIATMRCTYADGKQVKAGPDEIELPGGNNQQLTNLRAEYFALAADLKERKTALGMKPGIESEEILDKAATGLYDDETKGIDSGAYASLYRAQMLGSDADQEKIDAEQKASKNRVIAGAVVGGVGVVGGVVGNSLINGKLGEMIKNGKNCDAMKEFVKQEEDALKSLKDCLKDAGVKGTNKLTLDSMNPLYPSLLSVNNVTCETDLTTAEDKNITDLFNVSGKTNEEIVKHMINNLGPVATGKLLGVTISAPAQAQEITAATQKIEEKATARYEQFQDAQKKDEESGCKLGNKTGKISDTIKETLSSQIQSPSIQQ